MKTSTLLTAALAAPLLLSLAGREAYTIQFAPAPGTTITKAYTTESDLLLDEMSVTANGMEMPGSDTAEMSMKARQGLTITDEYGATKEGRLEGLLRTFDSIDVSVDMELTMMGQQNAVESVGTSGLEGRTVAFGWDGEKGEHTAVFAEGEKGDPKLLEDLELDIDLRSLLPDRPLEIDEVYSIQPGALTDVLAPGGELHIDVETSGGDGAMPGGDANSMTDFRALLREGVEGDCTGKLVEVVEVGGARIARIALSFEGVTARADLTAEMKELQGGGGGLPPGMKLEMERYVMELTYEGEGVLSWNIDSHHIHALEVDGQISLDADSAMALDQNMKMTMRMVLSGEARTRIELR